MSNTNVTNRVKILFAPIIQNRNNLFKAEDIPIINIRSNTVIFMNITSNSRIVQIICTFKDHYTPPKIPLSIKKFKYFKLC